MILFIDSILKRKIIYFFALIHFGFFAQTLNLDQSVDYALKNNYLIQNKDLDQQIAKKIFLKNITLLLPVIDAHLNALKNIDVPVFSDGTTIYKSGANYQSTAELNLQQTLFDPAALEAVVYAKQNKKLEQYQKQKLASDIVLSVKTAFYALLNIRKQEEMALASIERLEKAIADARLRYQNGFIQQVDVDRIQVLLNNAQTEYKKIKRQIPFQENWLKFQINWDIDYKVNFIGDLVQMIEQSNKEQVQNLPIQKHIDIDIAEQEFKIAKTSLTYSKLNYLPKIELIGAYSNQFFNNNLQGLYQTINAVSFVGLRVSLPIFKGFSQVHQLKIKTFEFQKKQNSFDHIKQQLHLELQERKNNFLNSWDDYDNQKANMSLAQLNFKNISYQVNNGIRSSLEILNAQESLKNAEFLYIQSIYQVLVNTLLYEKSKGEKLYDAQ